MERIAVAAIVAVLITGCASHYAPETVADPDGFFAGIWHGLVFPYALAANAVSWVASLLDWSVFDSIMLIGRPNTGLLYGVGYAIGLSPYAGGTKRM